VDSAVKQALTLIGTGLALGAAQYFGFTAPANNASAGNRENAWDARAELKNCYEIVRACHEEEHQ